jgi:toxin ParE1/3/4
VTVAWSPRALNDLQDIRGHIAKDDPRAAAVIAGRIESAINTLADFPYRGRPGRLRGTRELVVSRTRYFVLYRVREDVTDIVRVVHGAQRWPPR